MTSDDSSRTHVRGSGLLLLGRCMAVCISLVSQVLVVRALSKDDFGALSYALALVAIGTNFVLTGMHRATARFVPLQQERGDAREALGTIVGSLCFVVGLGSAIVILTLGFRGLWAGGWVEDERAAGLLMIVILLLPIQAADSVFQSLTAVLLGAKAIFVRRHLLLPIARLLAVSVVLFFDGDATALAWGYVAAGLIATWAYAPILLRDLQRRRYLSAAPSTWLPNREVMAFALPILVLDVLVVLKAQLPLVLLEPLAGIDEVAEYRAVWSVGGLVALAGQAFKPLFLPSATRLFARSDWTALSDLHWMTARWLVLLSFPALAACIAIPDTIATLLFSERYASAGGVLALLAAAQFVSIAFGLCSYVLHAHARLGVQVLGVVIALSAGTAVLVATAPSHGALGAAFGTMVTFAVQAVWDLVVLSRNTRIGGVPAQFARVLVLVVALGIALYGTRALGWETPARAAAAIGASILVLFYSRRALELESTFPELTKVPLLDKVLTNRRSK